MDQTNYKDLIEIKSFIEIQNILDQLEENAQVIVLYGITGAGKTTIAHFMSGSELEKFQENGYGPWMIKVKKQKQDQIGHDLMSKTDYPQIYKGHDIIILDLPGVYDNRGWQQQVKNGYLTSLFLNRFKRIKFILVVDTKSISERGHLNLQDYLNQIKYSIGYLAQSVIDSIRIIVNKYDSEDYQSTGVLHQQLKFKYDKLVADVIQNSQQQIQDIVKKREIEDERIQTQSMIRKKNPMNALQQKIPQDIKQYYQIYESKKQKLEAYNIGEDDAKIIFKYIIDKNEIFGLEKITQNKDPFTDDNRTQLLEWISSVQYVEIANSTPTIQYNLEEFQRQHQNCFKQFLIHVNQFQQKLENMIAFIKEKNDQQNATLIKMQIRELILSLELLLIQNNYREQIEKFTQVLLQIKEFKEFFHQELEQTFNILKFYSPYDYLFDKVDIYQNLGLNQFMFSIKEQYKSIKQIDKIQQLSEKINKRIELNIKRYQNFQQYLKEKQSQISILYNNYKTFTIKAVNYIQNQFKDRVSIIRLQTFLKIIQDQNDNIYQLFTILKFEQIILLQDYNLLMKFDKKIIKFTKYKDDQNIYQQQLQILQEWDIQQLKVCIVTINVLRNQIIQLQDKFIDIIKLSFDLVENSILNENKFNYQQANLQNACKEFMNIQFPQIDQERIDLDCKRLEATQLCSLI